MGQEIESGFLKKKKNSSNKTNQKKNIWERIENRSLNKKIIHSL